MTMDAVRSAQAPQAPKPKLPKVADILSDGLDTVDGRHVVRPGDTASKIAHHFNIPWKSFQTWNPHVFTDQKDAQGRARSKAGNLIYPGDILNLRPPAKPDQANLGKAAVLHAKKTIDKDLEQLTVAQQDGSADPAKLYDDANAALARIPQNDPERAAYAAKVDQMKQALGAKPAPAQPTEQETRTADAKKRLDAIGGELADTHGHDPAKADALMSEAQDDLAQIAVNDPDRRHYEGVVADMQKLYDGYFPKQDPAVLQRRQDLDAYLKQMQPVDRTAAVEAIVQSQPEVVSAATPDQKAQMVSYLEGHRGDDVVSLIGGGRMGGHAKDAALDILKTANAAGELPQVLDSLQSQKGLQPLINQMGNKPQGVALAKLLLSVGAYKQDSPAQKALDYSSSVAVIRAAGFVNPPPPTLHSDALQNLDEPTKLKLFQQMADGNITPEDSTMLGWLAKHMSNPPAVPVPPTDENF